MSKHYLNNKDLYIEIIVSKEMGKLTPAAQKMLLLLCKNVIKKFYYKDLDDRNDCLSNAMYSVLLRWYNFDELKSTNAFAYFTEVIKRGIAAGWRELQRGKCDVSLDVLFADYDDIRI